MPEYDERYVTVLGYDLTGAVIERIDVFPDGLDLYLSTHRMEIPEDAPETRGDGYYLLSFRGLLAVRSDFPLVNGTAERLASEGNEIHAYGFLDEDFVDELSEGGVGLYFDTDWGLLEVASESVTYSL